MAKSKAKTAGDFSEFIPSLPPSPPTPPSSTLSPRLWHCISIIGVLLLWYWLAMHRGYLHVAVSVLPAADTKVANKSPFVNSFRVKKG